MLGYFNYVFENNSLKGLFGQNKKKLKVLQDSRYLQKLALNGWNGPISKIVKRVRNYAMFHASITKWIISPLNSKTIFCSGWQQLPQTSFIVTTNDQTNRCSYSWSNLLTKRNKGKQCKEKRLIRVTIGVLINLI